MSSVWDSIIFLLAVAFPVSTPVSPVTAPRNVWAVQSATSSIPPTPVSSVLVHHAPHLQPVCLVQLDNTLIQEAVTLARLSTHTASAVSQTSSAPTVLLPSSSAATIALVVILVALLAMEPLAWPANPVSTFLALRACLVWTTVLSALLQLYVPSASLATTLATPHVFPVPLSFQAAPFATLWPAWVVMRSAVTTSTILSVHSAPKPCLAVEHASPSLSVYHANPATQLTYSIPLNVSLANHQSTYVKYVQIPLFVIFACWHHIQPTIAAFHAVMDAQFVLLHQIASNVWINFGSMVLLIVLNVHQY